MDGTQRLVKSTTRITGQGFQDKDFRIEKILPTNKRSTVLKIRQKQTTNKHHTEKTRKERFLCIVFECARVEHKGMQTVINLIV